MPKFTHPKDLSFNKFVKALIKHSKESGGKHTYTSIIAGFDQITVTAFNRPSGRFVSCVYDRETATFSSWKVIDEQPEQSDPSV